MGNKRRSFATIGLGLGQFVLMIAMFPGRVGSLTLDFFVATSSIALHYPEGQVYLG